MNELSATKLVRVGSPKFEITGIYKNLNEHFSFVAFHQCHARSRSRCPSRKEAYVKAKLILMVHALKALLICLALVVHIHPLSANEIAFTIDDAPRGDELIYTGLERTSRIIDILKRHNIQAVFFANSERMQRARQITWTPRVSPTRRKIAGLRSCQVSVTDSLHRAGRDDIPCWI